MDLVDEAAGEYFVPEVKGAARLPQARHEGIGRTPLGTTEREEARDQAQSVRHGLVLARDGRSPIPARHVPHEAARELGEFRFPRPFIAARPFPVSV